MLIIKFLTSCIGRSIICQNRRGSLRCPRRKRIKILYANYGRTQRRVCPHISINTTRCFSIRSTAIIRRACNGRSSCRLYAKNRIYGDPCWGTYKYIDVKYQCVWDHRWSYVGILLYASYSETYVSTDKKRCQNSRSTNFPPTPDFSWEKWFTKKAVKFIIIIFWKTLLIGCWLLNTFVFRIAKDMH